MHTRVTKPVHACFALCAVCAYKGRDFFQEFFYCKLLSTIWLAYVTNFTKIRALIARYWQNNINVFFILNFFCIFHVYTPTQGGIKFEISWEPNFPVNNFARNNGKNRAIIKTIINISQEQDWAEIHSHWTQKIKYECF